MILLDYICMVSVELRKIEHLKNLLLQSSRGTHLLFDNQDIAYILSKDAAKEPEKLNDKKLEKIQKILEQVIALDSIYEQRQLLENLCPEEYEMIMRAYFQLVDSTITTTKQLLH